jgi:hypothetical protein
MKWVEIDGMEIGCHDVKWNKLDEVFVYEMKRQFSFYQGLCKKEGVASSSRTLDTHTLTFPLTLNLPLRFSYT